MARPRKAVSKAACNWRAVYQTPTSNNPPASSSCESTTTAIRRRVSEMRRMVRCSGRLLAAQHVAVAAHGLDERGAGAGIELAAQAGDVDLDDVAELIPVVVVKVFES